MAAAENDDDDDNNSIVGYIHYYWVLEYFNKLPASKVTTMH